MIHELSVMAEAPRTDTHDSRDDVGPHATRPGRGDRVVNDGAELEPEKGLEPLTCSLRVGDG